jgi:hypothetical protein
MAKEATGYVFVEKRWFESSLRQLLGLPKSTSEATVHLLIGEMQDGEPHGVWMRGVKSKVLRRDGAETTMDFLVPWLYIVGLGRTEDPANPVGFSGPDVTILKD